MEDTKYDELGRPINYEKKALRDKENAKIKGNDSLTESDQSEQEESAQE